MLVFGIEELALVQSLQRQGQGKEPTQQTIFRVGYPYLDDSLRDGILAYPNLIFLVRCFFGSLDEDLTSQY